MKKYNNLAFQTLILLPIICVFCLFIIILCGFFLKEQFFDFALMCIVFSYMIVMIWLVLFLLKNVIIITYYDEEKIFQKNLWKKKSIKFNAIKEIYIAGSYIYLTSKKYNLTYDKEKVLSRKIQKDLQDEIIIMITTDAYFLKHINFKEINVYSFKNSLSNILNKYLN